MRKSFYAAVIILASSLVTFAVAAQPASDKSSGKVYYRYTNEEGVKVLHHSIPPKYVPMGYEIVSLNGEVLKVVEPAPSEADAERVARERKQKQQQLRADRLLHRRYSSVLDIEAAKTRSLQELQSNISILNSNLSNVRAQIINQQEQAAAIERGGKNVSDEFLVNLATLQAEERDIQIQIKQREQEYQAASDKFDRDMKRFEIISAKKVQTSSAKPAP